MMTRRTFLTRTAGFVALGVAGRRTWLHALPGAADPVLTIYKSSTCTCCAKWVDHVKASGFKTVVHERENMDEVKGWLGVPSGVHSCHTGQVGSYLIEGHVPAGDIRRLLAERPKVAGLAVPGMPTGTPGMEIPGKPADRYEVVSFQRDGSTKVFARY
jgi:hypothetical protein